MVLPEPRLYAVGLSDLLDQDISSYELYQSLSEPLKRKIRNRDVNSFEDLQQIVRESSTRTTELF